MNPIASLFVGFLMGIACGFQIMNVIVQFTLRPVVTENKVLVERGFGKYKDDGTFELIILNK